MNRIIATCFAVLASFGGIQAEDFVSPVVLENLGLGQSWARPITAPWGADSIASQQLVVMEENPIEYLEIVEAAAEAPPQADDQAAADSASKEPRLLVRMRIDQIPANGHLSSREEAERRANNEIRRLKRKGIEASLRNRTVPRVHLFSLSDDGTLESRDAETLSLIHI